MRKVLFILICCQACCLCSGRHGSIYDGVEHKGLDLAGNVEAMAADTIFCPGAMSSMSGQWILRDSELVFLDKHLVGIKHYSLDGIFLKENVKKGRGPGEVTGAPEASHWDEKQGLLFVFSAAESSFQVFDKNDSLVYYHQEPWFIDFEKGADSKEWERRKSHPDVNAFWMYDNNYDCKRVYEADNLTFIPVVSEHPKLNGYNKSANSKKNWQEAGIIMYFDIEYIARTAKLIGNYPPVYAERNIPIFSTYDFFVRDSLIHVSFAADPNIYVLDMNGKPLYSYGEPVEGISLKFPETRTFETYEKEFGSQRRKYGYYGQLFDFGKLVFRSCHLDSGQWLLQVYEGDDLVRVFETENEIKIIGEQGGWFYADAGSDFRNERFVMIKFRI